MNNKLLITKELFLEVLIILFDNSTLSLNTLTFVILDTSVTVVVLVTITLYSPRSTSDT